MDPDILAAIDQPFVNGYLRGSEVSKMWEQAQAALPANEKLPSAWMKASIRRQDFASAQRVSSTAPIKTFGPLTQFKAASKAMIISKNKRRPFLQAVACAHLVSKMTPIKMGVTANNAPEISEKDRSTAEVIAFKFLSAAAKRVPSDAGFYSQFESLSLEGKQAMQTERAARAIDFSSTALQSPRDLQFLIHVFKSQGKFKEALAVLNDDSRTGLRSAIGAGSWELLIEKIKLLEACDKWEELWELCYHLLSDAERDRLGKDGSPLYSYGKIGEDFQVWRGLTVSAANIGTDEIVAKTRNALNEMVALNARNRFLAHVQFILHPSNRRANRSELLSLLSGPQNQYRATTSNFRDISHFSSRLTDLEKRELVLDCENYARDLSLHLPDKEEALVIKWVRSEVNSLKFDYNLVVSNPVSVSDTTLLEEFAANALRLYHISTQVERGLPVTERHCGDDAAILAAMACIHLAHQAKKNALLQCVTILELVLARSRHNYDAILPLIRVYLYQGAVSKAFEMYERLDIKNIQPFTLSWVLFTRISTLHPHESEHLRCDPLLTLQEYLRWAAEKHDTSPKILEKHFENDNAKGFCETAQFISLLFTSFSYFTMVTEAARMSLRRHADGTFASDTGICRPDSFKWTDVRDSIAVPSYEHYGQPVMDQYVRPGPIPATSWTNLQRGMIELRSCLVPHFEVADFDTFLMGQPDMHALDDDFFKSYEHDVESYSELTYAECWASVAAFHLKKALTTMAHAHQACLSLLGGKADGLDPTLLVIGRAENEIQAVLDTMANSPLGLEFWRKAVEQPTNFFEREGWEFFHNYYVGSEISIYFVGFLHLVLAFSAKLKIFTDRLPSKPSQLRAINNPVHWNQALTDMKEQIKERKRLVDRTVQSLQSTYRSKDGVQRILNGILGNGQTENDSRGFRDALELNLDRIFVAECCRDLAESWVDCLDGMKV